MTTSRSYTLNDVDLATVGRLVDECRRDPSTAQTAWSAEVRWTGAFRSEARIRDFAPLPSDEPLGLGGTDQAPNPVEQLLAALGNCLAVGYAANASAAGIVLDDLRIELEGDLDLSAFLGLAEQNAGYEAIRARVRLETSASAHQVDELHRRVVSTSPVGHTLSRPVPLQIELG